VVVLVTALRSVAWRVGRGRRGLEEHGTGLREIAGVGPVLAARILGRTWARDAVHRRRGLCELHRTRAGADCQRAPDR